MGDPPQCRNCQYYGHTATIVHHVVVGITPQTFALNTKAVQPNVTFVWTIIPLATKNIQYLKHFLNVTK